MPGLPRHLDGFRLAQITDAHLTGLGKVEEAIVRAVRTEQVQLLALIGDIVDSTSRLPLLEDFCSALRGEGRTLVATLGNWEHWAGIRASDLRRAYARGGARLLVNESQLLSDGVQLCATDDDTAGTAQLEDAIRPGTADAKLLLTHSPGFLDAVPRQEAPFALTIAGHTHGGQIRLGPDLVPFVPPGSGRFVAGWYDLAVGRVYVSRGTGTSILPARFTCRPELPIFRLRQG
ncbi:MAG TPA: metallophosphoesterase [Polyangiaceae bacterium]|nr:metallophosphoesterase [Polyangiaceae bacterium]